MIGSIGAQPRTVTEVVEDQRLDGELLAVHGILYSASERGTGHVLLPKNGWFDGSLSAAATPEEKSRQVRLDQPDLERRLAQQFSVWCGGIRYQYDCIVVGRVRHEPDSGFGASLGDLQLLVCQAWREMQPKNKLFVFMFPDDVGLSLPWTSNVKSRSGVPALKIAPI